MHHCMHWSGEVVTVTSLAADCGGDSPSVFGGCNRAVAVTIFPFHWTYVHLMYWWPDIFCICIILRWINHVWVWVWVWVPCTHTTSDHYHKSVTNHRHIPRATKNSESDTITQNDDKLIMESYRPAPLLSSISKVFEKVAYNQLYAYFTTDKLFLRRAIRIFINKFHRVS